MYSFTNFILILYVIGVLETTLIKACTMQPVRKLRDHHEPYEPEEKITSLENGALSTSHENSIKDCIGGITFIRILKKMTNIIPVPRRSSAMSSILNILQLVMGFLTFILDNYTPYLVPALWNIITGLFR
ncbi:unnamed protein product [Parnassius apollo]|uniref:(apollo) hypothetical protein n=1 Tax=Parnassius apollo TaxID=110799 RepID=A0A8S3Y8R2_PARAO|nr:unnamed protein product [Parnassius apollo]